MRFLIGATDDLAQIVACEPVVRYLKQAAPAAHVTWAVQDLYRPFVASNPSVDQTIAVQCVTDWIRLSRHSDFDRIVDLHFNYTACDCCGVVLDKIVGDPLVSVHERHEYGSLLQASCVAAALVPLSLQPELHIAPVAGAGLPEILPARYCVLHTAAEHPDDAWRPEGWRRVAQYLTERTGLPLVRVGSRAGADDLPGALDLAGRLAPLELASIIGHAALFLGVEGAPAHIANAARRPGVVVLGRKSKAAHYNPFSGFYAGASPAARVARNIAGPARELSERDVLDALDYVLAALEIAAAPTEPPSLHSVPIEEDGGPPRVVDDDVRGMIARSGYFDAAWYALHHGLPEDFDGTPLDHYLLSGARENLAPGPYFDAKAYLDAHPDVRRAGVNPLQHYLEHGKAEGRFAPPIVPLVDPVDAIVQALPRTPAAFPLPAHAPVRTGTRDATAPRVFALYLPQFHPIAENDYAHGPGFVEWHNLIGAKPQFTGHAQPRMPGELGFYDLRSEAVLQEQIALARAHGIDGFCFYYYYFEGKKLLYKPIENYLRSTSEAPFMLMWANHNWTKQWDVGDREVFVHQRHSAEDDLIFIRGLEPLFLDHRYAKIDGKPILLVFRVELMTDPCATARLWRREAERMGLPGLYLVMVDDVGFPFDHPSVFGFDATFEMPSNWVPPEVMYDAVDQLDRRPDFQGRIVDYAKFAHFHHSRPLPRYKRFRTVMLPWDNTPRYGVRAMIHVNDLGEDYQRWLVNALIDTTRRYHGDERIVFVHSWNEWCEGTYLEPDRRRGRMFLEQTRRAVEIVKWMLHQTAQENGAEYLAEILAVLDHRERGQAEVMRSLRLSQARASSAARTPATAAGRGPAWMPAPEEPPAEPPSLLPETISPAKAPTEPTTGPNRLARRLRRLMRGR